MVNSLLYTLLKTETIETLLTHYWFSLLRIQDVSKGVNQEIQKTIDETLKRSQKLNFFEPSILTDSLARLRKS